MAPPRRFANYPGPKEAPAETFVYKPDDGQNPVLRGWPLVIVSALVCKSTYLQKLLWENAGFGKPKAIPGLDKELRRFDPAVIPLADGTSQSSELEVAPELFQRQPEDLAGRFYSAADYHALYKAGELTPLQVAEALLPLIRRDLETPSKYANAWLQTNVDEVLSAARASTARWATGKPLGLLDGVPFGVKDDIDVKGFVTTAGRKVDKSHPVFNSPADQTEWPVQKLEEAGAIMMGKMNMHEVGMDTTGCNPSTGTATNWYNKSYYPGGSSSGAGSALGGGIVPLAIGTDAGGSIRIPTSFNGVYGLKVTFNRTGTRNSTMCVVGPMSATVDDLTVAYRLMAQPNPEDPVQSLFAPSLLPDPSAKKYIGVHREWLNRSSPEVLETVQKAIDYLCSQRGYETVDIQLPYLEEGQLAHVATCLTEGADDAKTWSTAGASSTKNGMSLLNSPNRMVLAIGSHSHATDYLKYAQLRQVVMRHMAALFERHPGLLVVTPTTPLAGWPVHPGDQAYGVSDGNTSVLNMTYCWFANTTGLPAVTCPAGYVAAAQGEGSLPVGIMAVGEWGAEEQLLGFAREAEAYLGRAYPGGRLRPAEWADVVGLAKEKVQGATAGD